MWTDNHRGGEGRGGTHGLGDALGVRLHGVLAEELAAIDARQLQPQRKPTTTGKPRPRDRSRERGDEAGVGLTL